MEVAGNGVQGRRSRGGRRLGSAHPRAIVGEASAVRREERTMAGHLAAVLAVLEMSMMIG
jgi:hypothetical protein